MTLNGQQFRKPHEQTLEEFEARRDVWWHGTGATINRPGQIHLGTRLAAQERMDNDYTIPESERYAVDAHRALTNSDNDIIDEAEIEEARQLYPRQFTAARFVGADATARLGRKHGTYRQLYYGADHFRAGDPLEDMTASDASSELSRNEGLRYINATEDEGSTSLVVGSRAAVKTHEDYVIEARRAGKDVSRASSSYKEIPGQQDLFLHYLSEQFR